jgi:thioredoxin reductase (NADPH)
METFDAAVIGGGPAGLTASMYIARSGYTCAVFEQMFVGGQIALSDHLENYPGYMQSKSGLELTQIMLKQAESFGAKMVYDQVVSAALEGKNKELVLASGKICTARSVVIASGAHPAKLRVPGEAQFAGRGVSYCATCDGNFFKGQNVCVVGGGDTAVFDAMFLSKICNHVTLIVRSGALRAQAVYHSKLFAIKNISVIFNTAVTEIVGSDAGVTAVRVQETSGNAYDIACAGVFVAVGVEPNCALYEGKLESQAGFLVTDEACNTSCVGVFAAGDIRKKPLRQVATAVGDGAMCAHSLGLYMQANSAKI